MDQGDFVFMAWLLLIERRYAGAEKWAWYVDPYCDVLAIQVDMITNGRNYEGDACKCPFVILICFYGVSYSVLLLSICLHQAHVQASIKCRSETHFKLRVTRRCCFIFTFITPRMRAERVGVSLAWKWQPVSFAIFFLVMTCRRVEGKDRI